MKYGTQIIWLIGIFLLGCGGSKQSEQQPKELIKSIKLTELNGDALDLTSYQGKAIFLNFWATWCKPCIQEMPTIAAAMKNVDPDKIVFLFASNEEVEQIEKFKSKRAFDFHYVRIENLEELSIQALPTTFMFDSEGQLKFSESGLRTWDSKESVELITTLINHEK